jgi:hypothetical protein
MPRSFRQILVHSHIAAVAIAVLLVWSLDAGARALGRPLFRAVYFLINVVAIGGIPYGSGRFVLGEWFIPFAYLFSCIIYLGAAWLLSHRLYGMAPFRSLSESCAKLVRRNHA